MTASRGWAAAAAIGRIVTAAIIGFGALVLIAMIAPFAFGDQTQGVLEHPASWVDLVAQAPIAAALAWALTLNAKREKERDDVRIKLEEMHLRSNTARDESMHGMQVEVGRLSTAITNLERSLSTICRSSRSDRVA